MSYKINDTVRLAIDIPSHNLFKGTLGVIVMEFTDPNEAYEIEFCNEDGEPIAQLPLEPNQIELYE